MGYVEKPLQRADVVDASRQILGALIVDVDVTRAPVVKLGSDKSRATLSAESMTNVDEWQTEVQLKSVRLGRIWLCTSS